MIQLPLIGAFLEATGMILEKKILKLKNMNFKNYTAYEFLAIVIMMLPIVVFFSWGVKPEAYQVKNLLLFAFIIIVATIANLLVFYSLKRESISEFEPIWLMQPLFTIVLAFILYQNERNWISIILALVASISLVIAHIKKKHFVYDKYMLAVLLGSFLFAVELVASKPILPYYTPFSFYFLRCLFIFVICYSIYRPSGKEINKKSLVMLAAIGIIWAFYRAIMYYGYDTVGIVFTTTLFILSPVFMLAFALIFLKEKPNIKQIISTLVIIVCVVLSILLRN